MSLNVHRREVLAGLLGLPLASLLGCGTSASLPPAGEIVGAAHALGHRLREVQAFDLPEDAYETARVVIVGGGIAGLSAAWKLKRSGVKDFILLELEDVAGGTARSGTLGNIEHPWGAHYLPAPTAANAPLVKLLDEMGLIEGYRDDGEPIYAEQHLCRDPEERVFVSGEWHEGLFPHAIATSEDVAQLARFRREIDRWVAWRDAHGRRAFTMPVANCSDAAEVTALDRLSLAQWLAERKFTSPPLLWWIEYATRDDYGLTLDLVSAWAGLFYFAARVATPGEDSQPFLTWPAGNGRLVQHFDARVGSHVRTGEAVVQIQPRADAQLDIRVLTRDGKPRGYRAQHVIFAAPQFLAPYTIADCSPQRRADAREFKYGAWLVANLLLKNRHHNVGFSPAWDNVLYSSASLGYVSATHQSGRDHGPTVWTYYYPFCQRDPAAGRTQLLDSDWPTLAEFVLADLETAHPEVRELVKRLDVILWGHAMIQPRVGFITGAARRRAAHAEGNIHFANTDLSGVALFEEAFAQGLRAAEEVLAALQASAD